MTGAQRSNPLAGLESLLNIKPLDILISTIRKLTGTKIAPFAVAFFSRSLVKVRYYTEQNSIFTNSFKMDTETRSGVYLFTLNLNIIESITKFYCFPSEHIICAIQPAAEKIQCEDLALKVNSMRTELYKYPLRNLYE